MLFTADLEQLDSKVAFIHETMPPTALFCSALLSQRLQSEVWIKYENQTALNSFEIRGALTYLSDRLKTNKPKGFICDSSAQNRALALALSAGRLGYPVHSFLHKNISVEIRSLLKSLGAEVSLLDGNERQDIEALINRTGYEELPTFNPSYVQGLSSIFIEIFTQLHVYEIDSLFVPVGTGSLLYAALIVRDLLGLSTKIYAVSDQGNPFEEKQNSKFEPPFSLTPSLSIAQKTIRTNPPLLSALEKGVEDLICVSQDQIAEAIRMYFSYTHTVAEGAGALSLAGQMSCASKFKGQRTVHLLTGSHIDRNIFASVLRAESLDKLSSLK